MFQRLCRLESLPASFCDLKNNEFDEVFQWLFNGFTWFFNGFGFQLIFKFLNGFSLVFDGFSCFSLVFHGFQ